MAWSKRFWIVMASIRFVAFKTSELKRIGTAIDTMLLAMSWLAGGFGELTSSV